jgi:IrrE N-terminal-like domain
MCRLRPPPPPVLGFLPPRGAATAPAAQELPEPSFAVLGRDRQPQRRELAVGLLVADDQALAFGFRRARGQAVPRAGWEFVDGYAKEVEVNRFAAELLVPRAMLVEELGGKTINLETDEQLLGTLAETFGVSRQMMAIRVGELLESRFGSRKG